MHLYSTWAYKRDGGGGGGVQNRGVFNVVFYGMLNDESTKKIELEIKLIL